MGPQVTRENLGIEMVHKIDRLDSANHFGAGIPPKGLVALLLAMVEKHCEHRVARGWPPYAEHSFVRPGETEAAKRWVEDGAELPPIDSVFFWAAKATSRHMTLHSFYRVAMFVVPHPYDETYAKDAEEMHRVFDESDAWKRVLAAEKALVDLYGRHTSLNQDRTRE